MKINVDVPAIVNNTAHGVVKRKDVVNDAMKQFDVNAGSVVGKAKVLLDSAKEITDEQLAKIKDELKNKMAERNFSPKLIKSILVYTTKDTYRLAKILVNDEYANPVDIDSIMMSFWNYPYKKGNRHELLEDAAKKHNYAACKQVIFNNSLESLGDNPITLPEQIKDMTIEVEKRGVFKTDRKTLPVLTNQEFNKQVDEILDIAKSKKGFTTGDIHQIKHCINPENVELVKVAVQDPNITIHHVEQIGFASNSENTELMLRALLNKDYEGMWQVVGRSVDCEPGFYVNTKTRIGKFDTLDARFAGFRRQNTIHRIGDIQESFYSNNPDYVYNKHLSSSILKHPASKSEMSFYDIVREYCTDDVSEAAKVLLEDVAYDNEIAAKILQKLTIDNVKMFKKALIEKDFATLEKLCNQKLNPKDIDVAREKIKVEFKTTSPTGKITRADFVKYIDDKFIHMDKIDTSLLKDSEVRNLAKLLGTTEAQIMDMDKREYRRLCIKNHPDTNPNDKLACEVFRILNRIFLG